MESSNENLRRSLIVDIDGTICDTKRADESYADLIPNDKMIKKLFEYQVKGYYIVLFTSRNMRTYNNNLGLINKNTAPALLNWLDKWNIPYDEILFGKPWPGSGFYVDDRSVRPAEFLDMEEESILKMLK